MPEKRLLTPKATFYFLVAMVSLSVLIMFGGGMMKYTDRPQFCNMCHAMMPTYDNWKSSVHGPVKCTDCHQPNSLPDKLVFKIKNGLSSLYKTSTGQIPYMIHTSLESKNTILQNCIRCHENTLRNGHFPVNTYCWECHQVK